MDLHGKNFVGNTSHAKQNERLAQEIQMGMNDHSANLFVFQEKQLILCSNSSVDAARCSTFPLHAKALEVAKSAMRFGSPDHCANHMLDAHAL